MFAFTHGDTNWVKDSANLQMNVGQVYNTIHSRAAGYPPMNYAIYYACSMFSANVAWFNAHFVSAANHFFAGFDSLVWSRLKGGDRYDPLLVPVNDPDLVFDAHLSAHSSDFISRLESGGRVSLALDRANFYFPPRGKPELSKDGKAWEFPLLDMRLLGDEDSLLNLVYGYYDAFERIVKGDPSIETLNDWYITSW